MKPNWTPRDSRHQSFHGSAKMSDSEEKKELTAIPWNPIKREDPLRNSRWQTVDSSVPPTRQTRDDCWSSRPWECRDKRRASFRSLLFASFSSFSFPWFSSIFFLGGGVGLCWRRQRRLATPSRFAGRDTHTHKKKLKTKKRRENDESPISLGIRCLPFGRWTLALRSWRAEAKVCLPALGLGLGHQYWTGGRNRNANNADPAFIQIDGVRGDRKWSQHRPPINIEMVGRKKKH